MNIRPIRTEEEFNQVLEAGRANAHELVVPRWVVRKDGGIIGAATVMPMVLVWMDTERTKVRDSVQMHDTICSHLALNGESHLCMPCAPASPYIDYLPKAGFNNIGGFNLFVKGLR